MELNDPVDLLAIKFLGIGIKLDFNATRGGKWPWLPEQGELMLEVTALVWNWRKIWDVKRK